jgi:hypothetical protein
MGLGMALQMKPTQITATTKGEVMSKINYDNKQTKHYQWIKIEVNYY